VSGSGHQRPVASDSYGGILQLMSRHGLFIAIAAVAGIAAVYLLPPLWLGPVAEAAAICGAVLAIIVRVGTSTGASSNATAEVLLSILNLPEQPLAKVREGWALTSFLACAAFLVSLGLSVLVRSHS